MKRIVEAGQPHHVVRRRAGGEPVFFEDRDYVAYLEIMAEACRDHGVEVLAYCLMPDHTHLVMVPVEGKNLSACMRQAHGRYSLYINERLGNTGSFWGGPFSSHLLDEIFLVRCVRYVEINPVKRDYVAQASDWPWSSARAHEAGEDNLLVNVMPLLERVKHPWREFLNEPRPDDEADLFYAHEKSGEPLVESN